MLAPYYIKLALHRCRGNLATVLLATVTMAVGIAACMTALTIFSTLEGEPLPGISSHLYVATMDARESTDKQTSAYTNPDSLLKLADVKALVNSVPNVQKAALAWNYSYVSNPAGPQTDFVAGLLTYGPALNLLGAKILYGRPWSVEESNERVLVAVIDTTLAIKLFGRPDAVGNRIEINGHLFSVIGIIAPWVPRSQFIQVALNQGSIVGQEAQLFLPVDAALDAGVGPATSGECAPGAGSFNSVDLNLCRWMELWASLKNGNELAIYQGYTKAYAQTQHSHGRFINAPKAALYRTETWMSLNHVIPSDVRLNLAFAFGLLILCMVNVGGLLAARFLRRCSDVAVRRALGASQRDIFKQHLVESTLLGIIGGGLSLPLVYAGMWVIRAQPVSYAAAAQFRPAVLGWLLATSIIVGIFVGILPALYMSRVQPALQIKET